MIDFKQYVDNEKKKYQFTIKSVMPFTEAKLQELNLFLRKYTLIDFQGPKKTILQDHPMDFPEVNGAEVFIIEIELEYPTSSMLLANELANFLRMPRKYLVVRSPDDPLEIENHRKSCIDTIKDEIAVDDLKPASLLSTDSEYQEKDLFPDGKKYFGNEYNMEFLKNLAALGNKDNVENSDVFNYSDEIEKVDNFNDKIADSINSVPKWENNKITTNDENFVYPDFKLATKNDETKVIKK